MPDIKEAMGRLYIAWIGEVGGQSGGEMGKPFHPWTVIRNELLFAHPDHPGLLLVP